MKLKLAVALLLSFSISFAIGASVAARNGHQENRPGWISSAVQVSQATGLPARITQAEVSTESGRGISEIRYSIRNESGTLLNAARVLVIAIGPRDQVKAGESWVEEGGLADGATKDLVQPLRLHLQQDDRVVVMLASVAATGGAAWSVDLKGFKVQDMIRGEAQASTTESLPECPPNFCGGNLAIATGACGTNGVSEFSCSLSTCSFSFKCK
jgi:hypothetical protein